jgi:hypothetical protein
METGEKTHPFTRLIALPEPIADLDQVTTVGQALRLAGHPVRTKAARFLYHDRCQ